MKIKVQCPCGSRFEFEAEPVNGQMPWALNCPTCAADATALANEVIRQQTPAAKPRIAIATAHGTPAAPAASAAPAAPAVPTGSRLRINAHHPEPQPAATPAPGGEAAPAAPSIATGSIYRQQKVAPKSRRGAIVSAISATVIAALLLGAWGWYAWVGSMPKKIYSASLSKGASGDSDATYHMAGPGQLVSLTGDQMALYDVAQKKELWSVSVKATGSPAAPVSPLTTSRYARPGRTGATNKPAPVKTDAPAPAAGTSPENMALRQVGAALGGQGGKTAKPANPAPELTDVLASLVDRQSAEPTVIAGTNDIWIIFADRVARYDGVTGTAKGDVDLGTPVTSLTHNDDAILAISQPDPTHKVITQISLPSGATQKEEIDLSPPKPVRLAAGAPVASRTPVAAPPAAPGRRPRNPGGRTPPPAMAARTAQPVAATNGPPPLDHANAEFIPSGANATEVIVKLLEHQTATSEAIKPKGKSILDSGNLTASQSMDAAQEMMNDMQRQSTGGKNVDDVSRYQVTLHRLFVQAPDWTGEVVGPPTFFPLKTVDVLASGTSIRVFDKNNKKVWESKLTYRISGRPAAEDGRPVAPCLETADTLYFADKGMLTAFELANGQVRWRLTTVGISKIQADEKGDLYLNTTTADPDSIQFTQQVDLKNQPKPLIMKVDPKEGKVLWKAENVGENCLLTGKFVYATRSTSSYAWLRLEDGPQDHYNIYRLNPANGHPMWNYYQGRSGVRAEANKNWIMLQLGDEVQVLKFLTL